MLWCCSDSPSASLLNVSEPVQFQAFRHHMSADYLKTSTSSLGCSTKHQTPKPNRELTPHVHNPKHHLPHSHRVLRPWIPCLGHQDTNTTSGQYLWHLLPLLHFYRLSRLYFLNSCQINSHITKSLLTTLEFPPVSWLNSTPIHLPWWQFGPI